MKLIRIAALAAVLGAVAAGGAQAQVKTYYKPKSMQEIRAERAAKAEREARVQMASDETHRRHEEAFAKVDTDRNGRINLKEFKEAQLHLEGQEAASSR
jgi:hypothetical protein